MDLSEEYAAWLEEQEIMDFLESSEDTVEKENKPKHPTKLLVVPAVSFLQSLAGISGIKYPLIMVLRGEKIGASWKVESREELLEKIKIREMMEAQLGYFEVRDGMAYIEFLKDRKLVVKTEWLPGVFHGQEVFNRHMPELAKMLWEEAEAKIGGKTCS